MFLKQYGTSRSTQGIVTDLDKRPIDKSRRKFVQGVAAGSALLASGLGYSSTTRATYQQPEALTGNHFALTLDYKKVNFTGADRIATAINGSVPAPVLRWRQGQRVTLDVTNNMAVDSSIHWHGLILPSAMDGVPGISDNFQGIKPGETFRYEFDVQQSGTYWYHSHSAFQEQTGVYGAIVIDPLEPTPVSHDREHVIVLSDWSDDEPENIYAKLKKMSHYYNTRERTFSDLCDEIQENGLSQTWNNRGMWNDMRMSNRDISDVTGYTYTFLMNGNSPANNWTGTFNKGERLLLRIINASAFGIYPYACSNAPSKESPLMRVSRSGFAKVEAQNLLAAGSTTTTWCCSSTSLVAPGPVSPTANRGTDSLMIAAICSAPAKLSTLNT